MKLPSRRSRLFGVCVALLTFGSIATAQSVGISTFAGQAGAPGLVNHTTGASARFSNPVGLAADATNIYVADSANNALRKIAISTTEVATMATGFSGLSGVAVDGSGNAYVADTLNHVIKKVTPAGVVSVVAGASGTSGSTNSTLVNSRFFNPQGIAVNSVGTLIYVADTGNDLVRRIDVNGDSVATIATGFKPFGLALNSGGTILYVADSNGHSIRSITLSGNTLTTVAGTVGTSGSTDSPALFRNPTAVAVDSAGDIYVADTGNHTIRKISGSTVTTLAGSAGSLGVTDGVGTAARFQGPSGIVATAANSLFIADTNNQTIRRAHPATAPGITSANSTTFTVNTAGTFTVTATGSPAPTFSVVSGALPSFATLNPTTGVISGTPTSAAGSPFTFTIQASNGVTPAATQAFTLTVNQPPSITSANNTTFGVNSAGSFTVTATGTPAPTFSIASGAFPPWASLDANTGVISGTPPNNTGSPFTFTIQASNSVGTAAIQSFTLTVNNGAGISTQPSNSTTLIGQNATFTVVATGTPAPSYQWQREPASGGGFSNLAEGGTYTGTTSATLTVNSVSAAMNGDRFQVVVNNGIGSAVTSSVVTLTAAQVPAITSAASTTFVVNQAGSFTITSTGTPAPTYSIASGTFPPWASLNATSGLISGTPTNTTGSPFTFTITASNGVNPAATQNFTLNVSLADVVAAISTQPSSTTVQLGANATFTAAATGTPEPTLRWQRQPSGTSGFVDLTDDGVYSGTTTGALTITNVAAGMTGDQFRLVATNTTNGVTNSATSNAVTLTVNIGTTITTFAGSAGATGSNDGSGTAARLNGPTSVTMDAFGNLYVADTANHVIRKITSAGVVTTLAGSPGLTGSADGVGSAARFNGPSAVAADAIGNVYVADTYNHTIRVVSESGNVTTLAGLANTSGLTDGTGNAARFSFPAGIAIDGSVNIYVADSSNHTIRRVTIGGVVTTFAGSAGSSGSSNGNGSAARFTFPNGLAIGPGGVIYVADSFNHLIRRISPTADVTTLAGGVGSAGSTDANGTLARFNQPNGVAVDSAGVVYVADTFNHTIRKITTAGDVTTLAGAAGVSGSTDGVGAAARFNQPFSLVVDVNGNLFIADTRNHTIRRSGTTSAPGIATQPQNRSAPAGGSATFTVVATGTPAPTYQWQRQAAGTVGFINLTNTLGYSGVNTATLTVSNVLSSQHGDQFRVVLSNGISPTATSEAATLTIGEAPAITSAATVTVRATDALNFTFTASGSPSSTFTATPLPSWASLSSAGVLSGTPPAGSEGTYTFTVTANNGATATQTFTLTVTPAIVAPTVTTQPVAASVNQGQSATFSVTAAGTAPLSYQWRRNGSPISGATNSSYTVGNAQLSTVGTYSVTITNTGGSITSSGAELIVNTPPVFTAQPRTQTALAGSTVTFSAGATGAASFNYQWRRDGVPIEGATNATLTLTGVTAANSGLYDVQVSNALGLITSSIAQLTVTSTPSAPVITAQPASRTVVVGGATTLSVGASGAPAPSYQWRKDGVNISGANAPTYLLSGVRPSDGGSYDVVISNSAGSVTSAAAALRVAARSYAGIYLGTFMGAGDFGLYVREDNTAVLIGHLGNDVRTPIIATNLIVDDDGRFSFAQVTPAIFVNGVISANGNVDGTLSGVATAQVAGSRAADTGSSQSYTGFYQAGAPGSGTTVYAIVAATGQGHVVARSGTSSIGSLVPVSSNGQITLANAFGTVALTIDASTGIASGSVTIGSATAQVSGGSDAALQQQRLVNISSRARVGTGDSVAIAGFVISGEESKPVLIRAVGPTLGAPPFNIPGVLASPRLELFRATGATNTSVAVNTGISGNRAAIDLASSRAGAFALGASGNDAALLLTLAPGNYTASVSSTTNAAGVALIEVYDLTAPAPGQKMLNISTRASAGSAENTLIAGFVVPPGSAKRVLVRGIGPGLAQFGVTGVLAQPTLTLINNATGATLATNTNWNTSTDAAALSPASNQVGGFPLANNDSALIATLPPGNYTAQVIGAGGATGIALIEVYELP